MKRLFNLLLTVILSISMNVDVTWRDNASTAYNPGTYYHAPTDGHVVSTRKYENGKYETNSLFCTETTKDVTGVITVADTVYRTYWIGIDTPVNLDASSVPMKVGDTVVAPFDCKVVQIDKGTPNGVTMYVGFTIDSETYYLLQLENLERVYCCRNRGTVPSAGWLSHSVDVTGNILHSGDMLGIAGDNTIANLYIASSDYTLVKSIGAATTNVTVPFGDALK